MQEHAVERAGTTPIQALPPASAIDLDVLDALPLHLKRELERAYGETKRPLHQSRLLCPSITHYL